MSNGRVIINNIYVPRNHNANWMNNFNNMMNNFNNWMNNFDNRNSNNPNVRNFNFNNMMDDLNTFSYDYSFEINSENSVASNESSIRSSRNSLSNSINSSVNLNNFSSTEKKKLQLILEMDEYQYKHIQKYDSRKETSCSICLEEFKPIDIIKAFTTCQTIFHKKCLLSWLKDHNICPLCKHDLSDDMRDL